MNLKTEKLNKDNSGAWDQFCDESADAWFWHRVDWIEYIINSTPRQKAKNFSFFVRSGNGIEAIVPLTLVTNEFKGEKVNEFFFGVERTPYPAFNDKSSEVKKEEVYKFIVEEIDRLARKNKVVRAKFGLTVLAPSFLNKGRPYNYLMKYGYGDVTLHTQLIDLKKSEDELWKGLRRNHRRNIKDSGGRFKMAFYTAKNITKDIFYAYKEMHRQAAGRQTRPDITFELMYKFIKEDLAFLIAVEMDGKVIGFEYYIAYKNNVYGASSANALEYSDLPVRHFLEWEAILWMKKRGFSIYEIGFQQFSILPHDFPEEKNLNISHFKRGFGGFTVPWFMAEKYYNGEYFLERQKEMNEKYAAYLNSINK